MQATRCCQPSSCEACPARFVCHCLQVTEETIVEALETLDIDTISALREKTKAGGGCMACHGRLRKFIEAHTQRRELLLVGEASA